MFDRGYNAFKELFKIHLHESFFVVRAKKNLQYNPCKWRRRLLKNILTYAKIEFTEYNSFQKYPERLRLIKFYNEEQDWEFAFLTNAFHLTAREIANLYKNRWQIELFFKQLKQNFPLHFLYGDSVNAIQIQTWVVLIANLLITVLSRSIKRHCAFSQVVTMVRLMLMYYVDFIAFMENPEKTWNDFLAKEMQKAPPEPSLFD